MPSLIKDSTITFLTRGLVFVLAMATSMIIARLLGPSLKGSYNLLILVINVASLLVLFGLGSANIYYGARDPDGSLPTLMGNSLVAALGLGLIGIIGVELATLVSPFQRFLAENNVDVHWVRRLIWFLPLILANAYLVEILRAKGDILRYNLVVFWNTLTSFVGVGILVGLKDQQLGGAVWAWILSTVAVFALTGWLAMRAAGGKPRFDWAVLQRSLGFGIRLYPGNIAQFLNYRLDRFLVALYLTPTDIGLYATVSTMSEKLWEIPHAIRTVLLHRVASLENKESANAMTARVSRVVVVLVGGFCLLLALSSHYIILLLYGKEYLPAVPSLILLMPGTWALSLGKLLAIHLAGSGRPEVGSLAAGVSLVSTIVLDVLLIPQFGIVGASVASSIAYTLSTLVIVIYFLRVTRLRFADIALLRRSDILTLRRAFVAAWRQRWARLQTRGIE